MGLGLGDEPELGLRLWFELGLEPGPLELGPGPLELGPGPGM